MAAGRARADGRARLAALQRPFYLWTAFVFLASLPRCCCPTAPSVAGRPLGQRHAASAARAHGPHPSRDRAGASRRGQAIYASKHQSAWDTLIFALYLNKPAYVLKRELSISRCSESSLLKAGHIAVDREGGTAALKRMLAAAKARRAERRDDPDFSRGNARAAGPAQALSARHCRALRRSRPAGGTGALNSGLFWSRRSFIKKPG